MAATHHSGHAEFRHVGFSMPAGRHGHMKWRVAVAHAHGISCVPYARQVSGIMVAGNAWQWWDNAAGQYARGNHPEPGSVLNFRANGRMPLGHVAVVSRVINAREIIIDQANWGSSGMRGSVSRNVAVVDVSEANNWSAVRVELGNREAFGSVYPTYGFIYNRPDNGMVNASIDRPAPLPAINPVPSDLRPVAERPWHTFEEVAESPEGPRRQIDMQVTQVAARYAR
jgi:surface antigen